MTLKDNFDLAVVGGGPGGYVAAIRATQLGARTALVEKGHLGGVCTNAGCIPTKALVHTARMMARLENAGEIGLDLGEPRLNFANVAKHRDQVVAKLRKGIGTLLQANNVELIRGTASFRDEHTLSVAANKEERTLSADKIVIATGSVPVELPLAPFDGDRVIDSSVAVNLDELPGSLLIVGGGYIGCEFAAAFTTFGVEVTVVELMDRILPLMDEDCGREVFKLLKKRGAAVHVSAALERLEKRKTSVKAVLSNGREVEAERALISVGRRARTEGLGLDKAGVKTDEKGTIKVNNHMQTSRPHIYAVGDVTGGILLAHVASHEGTVAAAHATGTITAEMDYRVVPSVAFTFPEIATVGLSEQAAREKVGEIVVKKFPMRALGKAHIEGETNGFVKMLADARTGQLLGVHMVSQDASNLIGEAALALQLEATAEELAGTIHAHPTMPEALREAAEGVIGLPIDWTG